MNRIQFEEKVRYFESLATRHPAVYRLGAVLFAIGGYVVIFGLMAVVVGVLGVVTSVALLFQIETENFFKILVVVGIVTIAVLRALWVRLPEPAGESLRAGEAPELFRELEEIRRFGKGPRIHQVLLTRSYNAAVIQRPRFGIFGGHKNYLMLGAPLMMGLDPAQFRAVLAHEIGHLSSAHSKLSAWVYRLRVTWSQVLSVFQGGRVAGMFKWYLERFNAYTFVLLRLQEMEADRFAARLAGSRALADALVAIAIHSRYLDRMYWSGIQKGIGVEPVPAATPFTSMEESLERAMLEAGERRWLDRALLRQTNSYDTHPALKDRVALLNEAARLPEPPRLSAADCYLGSAFLDPRLSFWDRQWSRDVSPLWAEKHREFKKSRQRLEELRAKAATTALHGDEEWEIASLTEDLEGPDAAIPLIRAVLEKNPNHVTALFNLGRLLLERDEEEGVACLENAMRRDKKAILLACDWIALFWEDRGLPEKARAYWSLSDARGELMERNAEEKSQVNRRNTFLPHGLSIDKVEPILRRVREDGDIKTAYLVRKALKARMEDPLPLVLALVPRRRWYTLDAHTANQELQTRIAAKAALPDAGIVITVGAGHGALRRKIRRVPGAEIYRWKK
jgi:Zn-dependent protease with chaperone function